MTNLISALAARLATVRDDCGQTMAEYAVVLGVITIAVVVTLSLLSAKINVLLNSVVAAMSLA